MLKKSILITLLIGLALNQHQLAYAFSNEDILAGKKIIGENLRQQNPHFSFTIPIENQVQYKQETEQAFKQIDEYIKNGAREYDRLNIQHIREEAQYSRTVSGLQATITLDIDYLASKGQENEVNTKVDQVLSEIITPDMDDHQKVKVIHDWIIHHVKYDKTYQKYSAYNAAMEGNSVCQGFALLGYKMFSKAGIPTHIVSGTGNGGLHAWNMVQIEGNWYQIDMTWDENYLAGGADPYAFYLKTNEQFQPLHQFDASEFPVAHTDYISLLKAKVKKDPSFQPLLTSITKDNKMNMDLNLLFTSSSKAIELSNQTIQEQAVQVNQAVVQPMMDILKSNAPVKEKIKDFLSIIQSLNTRSTIYLGLGVVALFVLFSSVRRIKRR